MRAFCNRAAPPAAVEVAKPALRNFGARRSTTSRLSSTVIIVWPDAVSIRSSFIAKICHGSLFKPEVLVPVRELLQAAKGYHSRWANFAGKKRQLCFFSTFAVRMSAYVTRAKMACQTNLFGLNLCMCETHLSRTTGANLWGCPASVVPTPLV